jgi:cyanophycinase-like exopeptidase
VNEAWALLGSGEFEPWTEVVDRWMLSRPDARPGPVLILPTASAPEGDEVFDRWANKGLDHFARLGIEANVVPLKTREDAHREDLVRTLDGASVAYFSGGNPASLVSVLHDTPFWNELREHMGRGLGYVGCSAGVASLGEMASDSARDTLDGDLWTRGLGVFGGTWFGPHWDALDRYVPGLTGFIGSSLPDGTTLIGIDEDTAMTGEGSRWNVLGAGSVHLLARGTWTRHGPGRSFDWSPRVPPDRERGAGARVG